MSCGTVAAVSGGFDPLHVGHINLFGTAKALVDCLVVIVESDEWIQLHKHPPLMPLADRMKIIKELDCVDLVLANPDLENGCSRVLEILRPEMFIVGPDHVVEELDEWETCQRLGIDVARLDYMKKDRSSSDFIRRVNGDG